MANLPRVLYGNSLRDASSVAWGGSTVSGFEPANSYDYFDWTLFRADSGNLDFTVGTDTDIDSVSIYVKTTAGSNSIVLQYESSPSVYTTLQTYATPSGKLTFDSFNSVTVSSGRNIRFVITAATTMDIRQLWVGEYVEFPTGQWDSATSPILTQGIKVTNNISVNGSFLGRSIKRVERSGRISLDHLTQAQVRSTWEPFADHCVRYPFVYQWNPDTYPDEIGYCFAEKINAPQNANASFMSVEMPLRMLVADEEAP